MGMLATLEEQLCEWLPGDDSPDRLDALVWGMTELMITGGAAAMVEQPHQQSRWGLELGGVEGGRWSGLRELAI